MVRMNVSADRTEQQQQQQQQPPEQQQQKTHKHKLSSSSSSSTSGNTQQNNASADSNNPTNANYSNNIESTSSSTSSLNSSTSSNIEHVAAGMPTSLVAEGLDAAAGIPGGGIVMIMPQHQQYQQQHLSLQQYPSQQQLTLTLPPQQQQQLPMPPPPQQQQQQIAYHPHMQHVPQPHMLTHMPQHHHHHHQHHHQQQQQQQIQTQQQHSPSEMVNDPTMTTTPPLLQQAQTPPQAAQMVQPVCAVHHPQQHQQQMALVAAMQSHAMAHAAAGGSPLPPHQQSHPHMHPHAHHHVAHGPPTMGAPMSMENGHNGVGGGGGLSPNGSTTSSVSSNSNSGSGGGATGVGNGGTAPTQLSATLVNSNSPSMAGPPPPPPVYIQYHPEYYPAEYYIAPHPHEGICPQHSHHHQALCAITNEYGPTTVQMVSQNRPSPGPPMPVPVQVPQGQVMQQYVNESGTLTHVVLSPQQYQQFQAGQGHIHPPFITTNGTSHFYAPIPSGFAPPPPPPGSTTGPYGSPYAVGPPPPPTQPGTPQPQQQHSPAAGGVAQQQQQQLSPASHSANHSPSPPSSYHKDERTQRQHTKLLRKLEKQREFNSAVSSPNHSPSPRRHEPHLNGHGSISSNNTNRTQRKHQQRNNNGNNGSNGNNGNSSNNNNNNSYNNTQPSLASYDNDNEDVAPLNGEDDEEEDYQASIVEQLSSIQKPDVSEISARSAKILWEAPPALSESAMQLINMRELRYNVLLSDRSKDCKYRSLYKGSSYDCIVQDLKPGQDYVVRLQVHYEHLQGTASEQTEFSTPACEPDRPAAPRMVMCTKNSLHLRWNNPASNGSAIQHFLLEFDEGKTGMPAHLYTSALNFVEAVKTKGKQYIMTKLQPSTVYNFRLAAVNEVGASAYSPICSFSTQGNPPAAPKAPILQAVNSGSMRLVWERRQTDGATCIYVLQMLDSETGHGYLNMYNGPDCAYECCQLRRATLYYFRLRAENEAGASAWSNEVAYKTSPERPGRPGKPFAKGKIHGSQFRVRWDSPTDNGGAEVQRYFLEMSLAGQKFERIYTGADAETTCDRLQPGTVYQLRVSCEGPGGLSPFSEIAHITSEAVVPGAPPAPYFDNPPGPYAAVLRLDKPEYSGGAAILEYELQLRKAVEAELARIVYRGKDAYCVVKDLQPGNQYEVNVRAINRIGTGAWSPVFKFSAAAAPPSHPESLKVIIKSATHLHVSWQEPGNKGGAAISEYRLESAAATAAAGKEDAAIAATAPQPPASSAFHGCYQGLQTAADIRNLMPFTYYYFRVNACNVAGVSKWSPPVNCQTPAAVPAAPQIKDYEFTSNEATLRWSVPECNGSPITNYTIEYSERTIMTPDSGTEYTVTSLHPETTYKFRVQAINNIGSGSYSAYAKLTTLPSPPRPPKLECSGVGHNFIKLKWGDGKNLDFTKFYVEMYVQRAKEFQSVYTGTNCMCKVNKLQERTDYTFRIYAGNDRAGTGEYSEEFIFSTTACPPASIKAPRISQNSTATSSSSNAAAGTAATVGSAGATTSTASLSSSSSGSNIPSGMLPDTPNFFPGLGNLMLSLPTTLEWQHSKNSFTDRVEYMLQYAIGKDGEFKKIYRGSETKFTINNLEPGGLYQFRVSPIRIMSNGDDLMGAFTPPFRYLVPLIPDLDDIDSTLLNNAAASMFASLNGHSTNGNCGHGHSHHHSHMPQHHTHHNSRHSDHHEPSSAEAATTSKTSRSSSKAHHRSVSASAASTAANGSGAPTGHSSNSGKNHSDKQTPTNNTLLIGSNSIGFIPLAGMASELAASFAGCDDPNHHHHHHAFPDPSFLSSAGSSSSNDGRDSPQSAASLLAASANQLFANNPILLQAASAAISHHQNLLGHHHQHVHGHQGAGMLRRFCSKLGSVYTNRKRFSDQEKAVIFMVSFLFFTFLFATLVKMFMR